MSTPLRIGVQLFPGDASSAIEQAVLCEELGFDSVWVADHFHGAGRDATWIVPEAFTLLGAMAAATSRVRLGSCVITMLKRDPAVVAHASLTLSALSRGRFELGLGTGLGPELRSFGISAGSPLSRLEEALEVIRGLFQSRPEQPFSYRGRWTTLEDAFLNITDASPPALLLATIANRGLEITERLADGWIPFALTPATYAAFLARMPRRRDDFRACLWIPTFIERPGEDRSADAEAVGRMYLSMAPSVLAAVLDETSLVAAIRTASRWEPDEARELAASVPRELALSVTLHGQPSDCVEQLHELAASGCECVILRMTDEHRRAEDMRAIADSVLPALEQTEVA
jgi:alkanesulfonate monooxygenase SsuD/methylene tetrahydromethanopterin reductase-like flavin-dependent oxidoreductase (luciferase family)